MKPLDLSRSVVLITGGARGIGLATAQAFATAGATVCTGDLDTAPRAGDPDTSPAPTGAVPPPGAVSRPGPAASRALAARRHLSRVLHQDC